MTSDHSEDPMQTVLREGGPYHTKNKLEMYCKRLCETGRKEAAEHLMAKHKR